MKKGKVYIVGSGPGDPGLLTLRGKELLERAEVVLYDYLSPKILLSYASAKSEKIYVGKSAGKHTMPQEKINELLCEKALLGKTVVRLKGGDPFVFGRGGEEIQELVKKDVEFEVVPGITAAIAGPAYAGIPVTHRDFTQTFTLVTGHEAEDKDTGRTPWKALASLGGTIAFYMGVKNMRVNLDRLIENGLSKDTPCAFIRWGTTSSQKTFTGTVSDLDKKIPEEFKKPPAMILVGEVAKLRDQMAWFEKRPLLGKNVVVTRARHQASKVVRMLSELGANCVELPTIKIEEPGDHGPIDEAISKIDSFEWIIFTSTNGVEYFFKRLKEKNLDARALANLKVGSIGPATTEELSNKGIVSDFQPTKFQSEYILKELSEKFDIKGKKILLARADIAPKDMEDGLKEKGALITNVVAYRTLSIEDNREDVKELIEKGSVDCITFSSSSTVKNFFKWYPEKKINALGKRPLFASIGPVTTNALKESGFNPDIESKESTIPALIEAVKNYYHKKG